MKILIITLIVSIIIFIVGMLMDLFGTKMAIVNYKKQKPGKVKFYYYLLSFGEDLTGIMKIVLIIEVVLILLINLFI